MFRHSPSRTQRSKGVKVKQILQITFLLAICFWLIYQVKHSHDKKKELDKNDTEISSSTRSGNEVIKFGRKDLPKIAETAKETEKHDEEEAEEEEIKHKAEERDQDKAAGDKDEEIDDHEEKSDMEIDREEDLVDEETEREQANNEKENEEEEDIEEREIQTETSSDDHDNNEGDATNAHEAREVQYKADDASSAVTHDTQSNSAGTKNNANTLVSETNVIDTEAVQNNAVLEAENEKTAEHVPVKLNETLKVERSVSNEVSSSENGTSVILNEISSSENLTTVVDDSTKGQNDTEGEAVFPGRPSSIERGSNSSTASETDQKGDNSIILLSTENSQETGGSLNSSNNMSEHGESETSGKNAGSTENPQETKEVSSTSSDVSEKGEMEASGSTAEAESSIHDVNSETENMDVVQHDPIDSSDAILPLEVREVSTDLETLPEIRTNGSSDVDAAAAE